MEREVRITNHLFSHREAGHFIKKNIGGVGTLIASLASLITFREYSKQNKGKTGHYILLFSAFHFGFLIILAAFSLLFQ